MKTILLASTFFFAVAGSAVAADAVVSEPTPEAAPVGFDWTGGYAGILAGYGTGDSTAEGNPGFDGSAPDDRADLSPDGFVGGAVAGYNWQRGQFVYGLEGELGYLGAKDSFWEPNGDDYFASTEYGVYGSLSGRLGFAIDRTLITARAGLIVSEIDYGYGDVDGGTDIDEDSSILGDDARAGFTVGTSLEHAFAGDWIARLDPTRILDLTAKLTVTTKPTTYPTICT